LIHACQKLLAGFFFASYVAGIQPPPSLLKKAASPKPRDYIYIEREESNPPLLQFMKGECHEKQIKHPNQLGTAPISQESRTDGSF
jgi:hypothetical protein